MTAAIVISAIVAIVFLVWVSIKIREHLIRTYNYDIFSWVQVTFSMLAIGSSVAAAMILTKEGSDPMNGFVCIGFALLILLVLGIVNARKTSIRWAALVLLIQILFGVATIVIAIIKAENSNHRHSSSDID